MGEERLQLVLNFFRALADASRLRILGILADRECSVDELARLIDVKPPTMSHHLSKLKELGLVRMRQQGTTHFYSLDQEALTALSRDVLKPEKIVSLADDVDGDAFDRKVLRDFFEGERLKEIPSSHKQYGNKKREVIMRWLSERFEHGVKYTEREVNEILKRHHPDTATLRRELVAGGFGLMTRDKGLYWRLPEPKSWTRPRST
jgi:DNA-binding transcriptional ArsR family regulator